MLIVIPRWRSSGAESIDAKSRWTLVADGNLSASTFEMAAVSVVLPWSTCPMVPMFTCGLVRSNLALATVGPPQDSVARHPDGFRVLCELGCCYVTRCEKPELLALVLLDDLFSHRAGNFRVAVEGHRVHGAAGGLRP